MNRKNSQYIVAVEKLSPFHPSSGEENDTTYHKN